MVNKQKIKGTAWERELVNILESRIPNAAVKRVPGSGAMGTSLVEPELMGDVILIVPGFSKKFRIEAKVGYGGIHQITVKRDWLTKIKQEASNSFSIPLLACKFSGAKKQDGVQHFISIDIDTFCDIINYVNTLKETLDAKTRDLESIS